MYRALGNFAGGPGYSDFSFREPERWAPPSKAKAASRVANVPVSSTGVVMGDDVCGPVLLFLWLGPDVAPPDAPAHSHASDNWRMSLRGVLPMGRDRYAEGDFRFQTGWKPYPSDNYAQGSQGGWSALLFADRRGMRVRHVKQEGPVLDPTSLLLAEWFGVTGDLVSENDADASGPAALATTLDQYRRGAQIDHSFSRSEQWTQVAPGVRCCAGLLGDRTAGPVIVLSRIDARAASIVDGTLESDVFRMVVRGAAEREGAATLVAGDMRVSAADSGHVLGVRAGDEGLDEVVVIADRRSVEPTSAVGRLIEGLQPNPSS